MTCPQFPASLHSIKFELLAVSQMILKTVPLYNLGRLEMSREKGGSAHGQEKCERLLSTAGPQEEPEQGAALAVCRHVCVSGHSFQIMHYTPT